MLPAVLIALLLLSTPTWAASFYWRSPVVGDGTRESNYRPALSSYVTAYVTSGSQACGYFMVVTDNDVVADSTNIRLPMRGLEGSLNLTTVQLDALKTRLDAKGIPTAEHTGWRLAPHEGQPTGAFHRAWPPQATERFRSTGYQSGRWGIFCVSYPLF